MYKYVLLVTQEYHHDQKNQKKNFFCSVTLCHVWVMYWAVNQQMMVKRGQYTPYLNRSHRARSIGTLLDPIAQKFFRARSARRKF